MEGHIAIIIGADKSDTLRGGTEDSVSIRNGFTGTTGLYAVETIAAAGMELASTQMNQMLQALASFGTPQGVDGRWTEEQQEGVNALISSYWAPKS